MIDEEATKEAFGYYSIELKPKSGKHIIAACDDCRKRWTVRKSHYRSLCHLCSMKGKRHPMLGTHRTAETKAKLSAANKGKKNPNFGKHLTKEHKVKLSVAHKGKNNPMFGKCGANSPTWQGGLSFEPYCIKFNNAFKEYIRAKFGYKCFLCPITQAENGESLSVHHVNYNKQCGSDESKCICVPLCHSCHSKTNYNRDRWQKIIMDKLHYLIIGWDI